MPRYSEAAKEQAKNSINAMLELIHQEGLLYDSKGRKKEQNSSVYHELLEI